MSYITPRENSNRLALESAHDFTNSGANTETTLQIVKLDSSGHVVPSSAATDKHIGVIMNNPASGDTADVLLVNNQGTAKVQAGGNISIGAYLTADSSGHAVATTTSGDIIIGEAVTAAASGQAVEFITFRAVLA